MEPNSSIFYVGCPLEHFLPHINHVSVSPSNGPTQGQSKTLTRSGKSSIAFIKYFSKIIQQMKKNAGFFTF